MTQGSDRVEIPLSWVDADQRDVMSANQSAMSHNTETGEFILTLGHMAPPLLSGSEEEMRQQASQLSFVPVRALARFSLTKQGVEALREVIQANLARYDGRDQGAQSDE